MTERTCRCEATIASAILEGYACGRPDCWRTAEAKTSFDAFVTELVAKREDHQLNRQNAPDRSDP